MLLSFEWKTMDTVYAPVAGSLFRSLEAVRLRRLREILLGSDCNSDCSTTLLLSAPESSRFKGECNNWPGEAPPPRGGYFSRCARGEEDVGTDISTRKQRERTRIAETKKMPAYFSPRVRTQRVLDASAFPLSMRSRDWSLKFSCASLVILCGARGYMK